MKLTKIEWRRVARASACVLMAFVLIVAVASDADAARKRKGGGKVKKRSAPVTMGVRDPRYADIIMNPVTGEIYHSDSADERRYPASLTKMMTLYLLFEALSQDKTSLNAHLDVSDYAASMPQTNLSLDGGDTIPVEIAIKALVVRSANDVAVVVGEALGGDVDHFAQMMTAKARALGMKNTVFKNPNGLPNGGQYTTARDMAKLGIALKRDFPQYYDYFATRQFSWNGVTYYTHNRVMLRYAGTDGIKTGYIGLSGFNVVTSVTRGGRPIVGAVMGGASGGWRDNRMIELLDQSYKIIAERGAARGKLYMDNLPLQRDPKTGKSAGKGINARAITSDPNEFAEALPEEAVKGPGDGSAEDIPDNTEPVEANAMAVITAPVPAAAPAPAAIPTVPSPAAASVPFAKANAPAQAAVAAPNNYIRIVSVPPKPGTTTKPAPQVVQIPQQAPVQAPQQAAIAIPKVTAPTVVTPVAPVVPATPVVTPIVAQPVVQQPVAQPAPINPAAGWGIQVGAFSSSESAVRAANEAYNLAKTSLSGARLAVAGPETGAAPVHRARLNNITEKQAKETCKTLIAHSTPCIAYRTN